MQKLEASNPPILFIIAGPNGAGKSTVSKSLLADFGIEAFDWDQEFYARWEVFKDSQELMAFKKGKLEYLSSTLPLPIKDQLPRIQKLSS